MPNVTMSVDEGLLKEARKIAIDRDTNVSELFRDYLTELTEREKVRREYLATSLDSLFAASTAASYSEVISRDELHER